MRRKLSTLLALLGAIVLGGAQAPADPTAWRAEQSRETYAVETAAKVHLVNLLGNVTLKTTEGSEVVVTSIGQRHQDDPGRPELKATRGSEGLMIEVLFSRPEQPGEPDPEWARRRVDLGVLVPKALATSIRTDAGTIEVEGLAALAELETTTGAITFRGPGGLRARSESGAIFAQLRASGWPVPVEITTTTGDIRAQLLEGAAATVEVETRGPITTDYSMVIERKPGQLLKKGRATVGAGGQTMGLKSYSGAVRLDAVIVPEAAAKEEE
ncbi:MAG: hypothetical protein HC897_13920 [Thermoanaerobaculia bacterium]|nr:hypothetical protein [Thermoanaerobaculia bacterium]